MRVLSQAVCFVLVWPVVSPARAGSRADMDTALQWLTRDAHFLDLWPCFSPDGRSVLFSRASDENGPFRLYTIQLSGGEPRPFLPATSFPSATRASWSLRHNRIALTGGDANDETSAIWTVDADGQQLARVPSDDVSSKVMYPSWDAGGESVVVVDFGAVGGSRLTRVTLQSGASRTLTNPREFLVGMPAVSPDGELIAFAGQRAAGTTYDQMKNHIWVLPREAPAYEISQGQGRHPNWSADGEWLAFTSTRGDSAGRQAIFVVSRRGGPPRRITSHSVEAGHPVWSPDGRMLVFSARVPAAGRAHGLALIRVEPR